MSTNGESRSLSAQLQDRGITNPQWHTLSKSLYPGAQIESVLMVIDYCRSRGLDPLKRPCHIVPMEVKVGNQYIWQDVIMPGIYEYRTTAQKTGDYLGHATPEFGEDEEYKGVKAPLWCSFTVYRWNEKAQMRAEYPVTVWFSEVVALKYDKQEKQHVVNSRWSRAPRQMLTKCAEAAALREAFPDELGGEPTFEEMVDQHAPDVDPENPPFTMSKPAVTKIIKAMEEAIDADDHGRILEIWHELDEAEEMYISLQLDRWRSKRWKDAIMAAGATANDEIDPNLQEPAPLD